MRDPRPFNYIASKEWTVTFEDKFEKALAQQVTEILDVCLPQFDADSLDVFFVTIWNDLTNSFNRDLPFIAAPFIRMHLAQYMWMQYYCKIYGPTGLMFNILKSPCMILTLDTGENLKRQNPWQASKLMHFWITLGPSRTATLLETCPFEEATCVHFASQKLKGLGLDKRTQVDDRIESIDDYIEPPWAGTFKEEFDRAVIEDLKDEKYCKRLEYLLNRMSKPGKRGGKHSSSHNILKAGAGRQDDKELDPRIIEIHKTLALSRWLLAKFDHQKQVTYFFNSSNIEIEDADSLVVDRQDGGSIVLVHNTWDLQQYRSSSKKESPLYPDDHIHYLFRYYYILSTLLMAKLSSIQKVFRQHSEEAYAVRAAVTAIMGRNMSHNIGSHVLAYLSSEASSEDIWI